MPFDKNEKLYQNPSATPPADATPPRIGLQNFSDLDFFESKLFQDSIRYEDPTPTGDIGLKKIEADLLENKNRTLFEETEREKKLQQHWSIKPIKTPKKQGFLEKQKDPPLWKRQMPIRISFLQLIALFFAQKRNKLLKKFSNISWAMPGKFVELRRRSRRDEFWR